MLHPAERAPWLSAHPCFGTEKKEQRWELSSYRAASEAAFL